MHRKYGLSQFSNNNKIRKQPSHLQNAISVELDKPLPPYSIQSWIGESCLYRLEYQKYLISIYVGVKSLFQRVNLRIDERFLIEDKVNTSHSREVLNEIFSVIKDAEIVEESARSRFLSMFSTTVNANEGQIEWQDINEKNDGISFHSLFILFKKLFEFDNEFRFSDQKSVIASFFVFRNANDELVPVTSEKIRDRKISKKNIDLKERIEKVLQSYYGVQNNDSQS